VGGGIRGTIYDATSVKGRDLWKGVLRRWFEQGWKRRNDMGGYLRANVDALQSLEEGAYARGYAPILTENQKRGGNHSL